MRQRQKEVPSRRFDGTGRWRKIDLIWITLFLCMGILGKSPFCSAQEHPLSRIQWEPDQKAARIMPELQVPFVANEGQRRDEHIRFYAQTFQGNVDVTRTGEILYSFTRQGSRDEASVAESSDTGDARSWTLKESLMGASVVEPRGFDRAETKVVHLVGNDRSKWRTDIPTYRQLDLGEVYEGIRFSLKAYGKNTEKIFTVDPGADYRSIRLKVEGVESIKINDRGELEAETGIGQVRFSEPVAFQEWNGERKTIRAAYRLDEETYGFDVGEYDRTRPLIIDPVIYVTYVGGSGGESAGAFAVDGAGNMYVAGLTGSMDGFPPSNRVSDDLRSPGTTGNEDSFVAKLSPGGTSLDYFAYLGGAGTDAVTGISVDTAGNVYLTGTTDSGDFPTTPGAYRTDIASIPRFDTFVVKLNASDLSPDYSTLLGGTGDDHGFGIAVDASGCAYVTGLTSSEGIATKRAYQRRIKGQADAFVAKLDPSGSELLYFTYLGGSGSDVGYRIALDAFGNAYITGRTASPAFPTTMWAHQQRLKGDEDAFAAKLNASGSILLYSTYLGGEGLESGSGIAVDAFGRAYIAGRTTSARFPTTGGAHQRMLSGECDGFVVKLSTWGSTLLYSTYLGGSDADSCTDIALDVFGNIYVTGETCSDDFPTLGAYQDRFGGVSDAFVVKWDASGSSLLYATYLGGSDRDGSGYIAVDTDGNAYIGGVTYSDDFPVTPEALQDEYQGVADAFVAKLPTVLSE